MAITETQTDSSHSYPDEIVGKSVVVIGGGTGSYNVLSGLKATPCRITAVVAMTDSGGSSGRLRDEFELGLRSFPVQNHVLFYRPIDDGVAIVRVVHGRRDLLALFSSGAQGA